VIPRGVRIPRGRARAPNERSLRDRDPSLRPHSGFGRVQSRAHSKFAEVFARLSPIEISKFLSLIGGNVGPEGTDHALLSLRVHLEDAAGIGPARVSAVQVGALRRAEDPPDHLGEWPRDTRDRRPPPTGDSSRGPPIRGATALDLRFGPSAGGHRAERCRLPRGVGATGVTLGSRGVPSGAAKGSRPRGGPRQPTRAPLGR